MKIVFLSSIDKSSKNGIGVYKKNIAQVDVIKEKTGFDVLFAYFLNPGLFVIEENGVRIKEVDMSKANFKKKPRIVFDLVVDLIQSLDIKFLYSRWESYSIHVAKYYRNLHKIGCKVLLEIPTYPVTPQRFLSIKQELRNKEYYRFMRRFLAMINDSAGIPFLKYGINRIVTNNGFNKIWGINTIGIRNGVDVGSITIRKMHQKNNQIHLIGVANVAPWHGYDRIIDGIYYYEKSNNKDMDVFFHIVGVGDSIPELKAKVKKLNLNKYIIFHGMLNGQELDDLFNIADVGISVLGVHRCTTKLYDSLKSKEYCSRGIPFITENLEKEYNGNEYVLNVSSDDSPTNIKDVITFALKTSYDANIIRQMRDRADKNYDWKYTLLALTNYIKENTEH
jgi:glycosyltransferase involved in cell wall biosynthesis